MLTLNAKQSSSVVLLNFGVESLILMVVDVARPRIVISKYICSIIFSARRVFA